MSDSSIRKTGTAEVQLNNRASISNSGTETEHLSRTGWTFMRAVIIMLCFGVNMIDGVDVLMLSYVAPTLSKGLGLSAEQLGVLFSAGLAGMAFGGLVLAPISDRIGRRPLILFSVALMSSCMILSGFAGSLWHLIILRLGVGAGIGAALASISTLAAEYAPPKHHDFAVAMLQGGYPIAATITGFIVAPLINSWGWDSLLLGSGLFSASAILPLFLFLPESITFLAHRQPRNALKRVQAIEARLGMPRSEALPKFVLAERRGGVGDLFREGRLLCTILLWLTTTCGFMTLYFIISWIPRLAVEAGLDIANSIYAGALYNIGAFFGCATIGIVALRLTLHRTIMLYLFCASMALSAFGSITMSLAGVLTMAFVIGIFLQGGFNGSYPLAAGLYPVRVRTTGMGWAMGVGRIGAVIGPYMGGILLQHQVRLSIIFQVYAIPLLICIACVFGMSLYKRAEKGGTSCTISVV